MKQLTKEEIADWFKKLQDNICLSLEKMDGDSTFKEDNWERKEGGGGRSKIVKGGKLIEKGGVNFSSVEGTTPKNILHEFKSTNTTFFATGVSIVLHPENPFVPIIHMNVRYFEMSNKIWWFGGGIDLTPPLIFPKKAKNFHFHLKSICDRHSKEFYPTFKQWADDYFFLPHRNETRGIGGIFFDRLDNAANRSKKQQWEFVQDIGKVFIPAYTDAVSELRDMTWTPLDKKWQKLRRGRYVEFNLIHDKGTKFGLETNGRTESILMSLPPEADWVYKHHPETDLQKETQKYLRKGIDWINS